MQTDVVRAEDVRVVDCGELLAELLGEDYARQAFTYEDESWLLLAWCAVNHAVYYESKASIFSLDAARALAAEKGRSAVVVELLLD